MCFFGFVCFNEAEMVIVFAAIIEKSNSTQSFVQIHAILFKIVIKKILQEIYNEFQPNVRILNNREKAAASKIPEFGFHTNIFSRV